MMNSEGYAKRITQVKQAASRLMHLHYCDNDVEGVIACFAPEFSWFGAGEGQYAVGREEAADFFRRFRGAIPKCNISDEQYDVILTAPDIYICSGTMWISTDPSTQMYLKVHQRVSFVFHWTDNGPLCSHIHCSNPYMEMVEDELFPDKIGQQSYEYIHQRLQQLEEEMLQKNRQLAVVMSSIPGGLKISRDDSNYSFAYVSDQAAALFGYTVNEFIEVSGGTAAGAVYPPDRARALADAAAAFQDGSLEYSTKYRVRCRDGSLKWILDSGCKSVNDNGETLINSLYLDITKSELDGQEILRQKNLLDSIYETVPCGILRFARDDSGRHEIISLNRAALNLLGYRDLESCQADWHCGVAGTVLEEDRPILLHSNDMLKNIGDSVNIVYRVSHPDGSIHWLDGVNAFIATADGQDIIQRIMYDVTEGKLLQQQLDQEQEMYRVAMESSSVVMYEYLVDSDTFITYEPKIDEKGQERVLRLKMPHYQEKLRTQDIVHQDDIPTVIDNICNGRCEAFEVRLHTPGSSREDAYQWHMVTGKKIANAGRTCRVVGTIRNIDQNKQALSANMEELHMNQSALQAISGLYMSIYYVELPSDHFYGVRIPELTKDFPFPRSGVMSQELAQYIQDYVDPADRKRMLDFCTSSYLGSHLHAVNDRAEIEFLHRIKNSQAGLWLRMEVHLISVENGKAKNAIITFRDVTAEHEREIAHRQEEANAKHALEEAYEAANRASRAKSDFLSKMSHDIRTPMNAILGMAGIAERNLADSEKVQDCLQKIQLSGKHLLSLINDVLDMSKIESGNVNLHESLFQISKAMQTVADIIRPEAELKAQHLDVNICPLQHERVYGDSVRIQQILLNLLSNAVKYTPEGGNVTLSVRENLSAVSDVGCYEFVVEDDGIGMSESFQRKLFRPFERADDSRVSQVQGTGLGMAITQNLVRIMNGSIHVESCLNEGSRFTVTVNLRYAALEDSSSTAGEYGPAEASASFSGMPRILLVEDNDLNREIVDDLLQSYGVQTEQAKDGKEALNMFQASEPGYYRMILMDIQMPVMDGYEATCAIRTLNRPDADTIPIIALTANAFADDVYRAKQAGMNEHLAKPLEPEHLMHILKHWLS